MTGRMASFTERRSCQISWQHAPLSRYIVQSLPLLNFFKRKPSQCRGSQYNGLLLLSPWDEQYQINFAKSIRIIFQRCVRCHRQRIFYSGAFDMALYPRLYPPRGSLIKMLKAFSHFTEILWLLGCWHDGTDKQVEGQSAQRNWLYILPGITPLLSYYIPWPIMRTPRYWLLKHPSTEMETALSLTPPCNFFLFFL